jgi:hypothetical protein
MKPFTQVILLLGLITLVFYALNPFESFGNPNVYTKESVASYGALGVTGDKPFVPSPGGPANHVTVADRIREQIGKSTDPSATSTDKINPDYAKIIDQYNQMAPEQQQVIQAQARQQRAQLGLSTDGAFNPPLAPGPVGANTSAPASPTTEASTPLTPKQLQGKIPSASQTQMDSSIQATATSTPAPSASVTLSDQQGLLNTQNTNQLFDQPSIVPVPNYVTSPTFNDILREVDNQQQASSEQQEKKDRKRASCKHKINTRQATYKPTSCPPPDPTIWIKRNEIPCWNCKV